MPIWGYIGGGALLMGLLGGWTIRDWKADSDALAAVEKAEEARKGTEERWAQQSTFYQDQLLDLSSRSYSNRETIRTIYRDREVPMECAAPADLNRVLDDAVRAANAASAGEPAPPVPTAGGATHTPD